jgi:hypothetical protein
MKYTGWCTNDFTAQGEQRLALRVRRGDRQAQRQPGRATASRATTGRDHLAMGRNVIFMRLCMFYS